MKKLLPFLAVFVVVTSCHKEHVPAPPAPHPGISKKLVEIDFEETPLANTKLTYDASGRMISAEDNNVIVSVNYNSSPVSYKSFAKAQNENVAVGNFTLDGKGNTTHIDQVYSLTPGVSDTARFDYEYNSDGYMTKMTSYYPDGTNNVMILEYVDGNMTRQTFINNGILSSYWIYTYSPLEDKTGINNNFLIYTNCLAGKRSKNLLVKAEEFDISNVKQFEIQYDNVVDADGYLVKKTTHFITSNTVIHYSYKYDL